MDLRSLSCHPAPPYPSYPTTPDMLISVSFLTSIPDSRMGSHSTGRLFSSGYFLTSLSMILCMSVSPATFPSIFFMPGVAL